MAVIATLVFGILGLFLLSNCVQNFQVRGVVLDAAPPEMREQVQRISWIGSVFSGLAGVSFALASLLVWRSWPVALLLGGWPILLFVAMLFSGNVDVITRFSSGPSDERS